MNEHRKITQVTRRTFINQGSLIIASTGLCASATAMDLFSDQPALRFGLITDLHYADKGPAGSRFYRETLNKLAVAERQFEKLKPSFVAVLGDTIDSADDLATEKKHLETISSELKKLHGKKHFVLGNHCVHTLTKEEFLGGIEQERSFYSFDLGGFHFIVLDACFRNDGTPYQRKNFQWTDPNIPQDQIDWLSDDLSQTTAKTIVFVHQRMDVENHYGVKNAKAVRKILEDSGKVFAVFQGHSHSNDYKEINGIHYCVVAAMVEGSGLKNNSFASVDLYKDGSIKLDGFVKQNDYKWG